MTPSSPISTLWRTRPGRRRYSERCPTPSGSVATTPPWCWSVRHDDHGAGGVRVSMANSEPLHQVWDHAMGTLVSAGVTEVFGLPDDDMHAMAAIERAGLRLHRVVRQTTAVHMAAGRAALRSGVGVCVIGRGP